MYVPAVQYLLPLPLPMGNNANVEGACVGTQFHSWDRESLHQGYAPGFAHDSH